jgi:transposase-like protein
MGTGYRKVPVLAIEDLGLELGELRGDPVEELARFGARLVLTSYMEEEVRAFLGADRYERTSRRRGSRNGHRRRTVSCGLGGLDIEYPKVRGTKGAFQSQVLDSWQRASSTLVATLPSLYVEGLSTRDFQRALQPLWEGAPLSRSSISRANEQLKESFQKWRRRSLEEEDIMYLFLDGHYEGVRLGSKKKEAILVAHGITKTGSRVLLGVYVGRTESTDNWNMVMDDLIARGLRQPLLVITDGNAGLIKAIKKVWPTVPRQRCIVHRIRNVLAKVPKTDHKKIRKALNRIFYAPSLEEALEAAAQFAATWQDVFPAAVEILGTDLEDCLTFFRFPPRHWKRIRTSNPLERCFREVKRRTRVIGRFPTEMAALSLVWSIIDQDAKKWRGIKMGPEHLRLVQTAVETLKNEPIVIRGFEELIAA